MSLRAQIKTGDFQKVEMHAYSIDWSYVFQIQFGIYNKASEIKSFVTQEQRHTNAIIVNNGLCKLFIEAAKSHMGPCPLYYCTKVCAEN